MRSRRSSRAGADVSSVAIVGKWRRSRLRAEHDGNRTWHFLLARTSPMECARHPLTAIRIATLKTCQENSSLQTSPRRTAGVLLTLLPPRCREQCGRGGAIARMQRPWRWAPRSLGYKRRERPSSERLARAVPTECAVGVSRVCRQTHHSSRPRKIEPCCSGFATTSPAAFAPGWRCGERANEPTADCDSAPACSTQTSSLRGSNPCSPFGA